MTENRREEGIKMKLTPEQLDKIVLLFTVKVAIGIAAFIGIVATVALFGTKIAPLMGKLPW